MSYENNFQMYFVELGLKEGERRGRLKAMRDIAYRLADMGCTMGTIAKCLGINMVQLRYLLNCTDWDICGSTVTACRINRPVYKK